ncbi:hypothetical protein LXL04_027489 [Taraxacum kok-saghyz]
MRRRPTEDGRSEKGRGGRRGGGGGGHFNPITSVARSKLVHSSALGVASCCESVWKKGKAVGEVAVSIVSNAALALMPPILLLQFEKGIIRYLRIRLHGIVAASHLEDFTAGVGGGVAVFSGKLCQRPGHNGGFFDFLQLFHVDLFEYHGKWNKGGHGMVFLVTGLTFWWYKLDILA